MNKTIPCGWGFPYGVFSYVHGSLFSPRRGHFWTAPPPDFFAGTPIIVITFFFTSQIFIFLPDRGGFNFLGNLFFLFLRGGGLREGGRLLSTFRLLLREHAGPGWVIG